MSTRPGAWSALPPGWLLVSAERLDDATVATSTAEALAYSGRCSCVAEHVLTRYAETLVDVAVQVCGCDGAVARLLPPGATSEQTAATKDRLTARLAARADDPEEIA